jgi:ribosomal protein S18 acetylase RimI-like enzyme
MSMRPFRLPADLPLLMKLLPPTFEYPDHPEWSLQADEAESFLKMIKTARQLWPLIFLLGRVSPAMRDVLHGFIWEEDGQPVGVVNVSRDGASDDWIIANVGVLPAYRKRGIARQLVTAAVNFARERRARLVLLDVVAGNVPAYDLYASLGFAHFSSHVQLRHEVPAPIAEGTPASGYTATACSPQTWRPYYELARRITPAEVQQYRPIAKQQFHLPASLRMVLSLLNGLSGVRERGLLVRAADGQVVATIRLSAHVRGGGINSCTVQLDPAHGELAPYLTQYVLHTLQRLSPKNRIEWHIPSWETALIAAAKAQEFSEVCEFHSMGMKLS